MEHFTLKILNHITPLTPTLNEHGLGRKPDHKRLFRLFIFFFFLLPSLCKITPEAKAQPPVPYSRSAKIRQAWSRPRITRAPDSSSKDDDLREVKKVRSNEMVLASKGRTKKSAAGSVRTSQRSSKEKNRKFPELAMSVHQLPPAWSPEEIQNFEKRMSAKQKPTKQSSLKTPKKQKTESPHKKQSKPIVLKVSQGHEGGKACIALIKKHKVPFVPTKPVSGIKTPIKLTGPINGITIQSKWQPKEQPVMDCRLALSLLQSTRILREHDVKTLIYSSVYRPASRNSRPSRHALGLAIDVRDIEFKDHVTLNVLKDWRKTYGRPNICVGNHTTDNSVQLRSIICDLEEANIFRRILTPDSDPGHSDHFHISVGKAGEKWERSRWAGRNLYQPLPGTRLYYSWYKWYKCYRYRGRKAKNRCYRARKPSWVVSGNPYKFKTHRYTKYLGSNLAHDAAFKKANKAAKKHSPPKDSHNSQKKP
jgi:hypothetical protein